MDIEDFIYNDIMVHNFQNGEKEHLCLSEGQRNCLNSFISNNDILIKKDRCAGVTTILAVYIAYQMLHSSNNTFVYITHSTAEAVQFISKVREIIHDTIKHEYNTFHQIQELINNKQQLLLNNMNKLVCGSNNHQIFQNVNNISVLIYDEVGLDKTKFVSLIKTIGLYKSIKVTKTIFTLTEKEKGKWINIPNEVVKEFFRETMNYYVVYADMLSYYEDMAKQEYLYDKIKELYE